MKLKNYGRNQKKEYSTKWTVTGSFSRMKK